MKRATSAPALYTMQTPIEIVITKVPINKVLSCSVSMQKFPSDLLDKDDETNMASCLAEPFTQNNSEEKFIVDPKRNYWLNRSMDEEETQEKYSKLYSRIRKKNK